MEKVILEKNEEKQIQGLNGSVIITVENDALAYHRYDDYGMNHSIGWGHSYNGEWIDSNGLVYLRARYYDPNGEIQVNFSGTNKTPMNMITSADTLVNWEMSQLYQNKVAFEKAIFYYNGETYVGYDVFNIVVP